MIAHPLDVPVFCSPGSGNTVINGIHCSSSRRVERPRPFVDLGMTISKGEAGGPIVIGSRLVNPRGRVRVEEPCIIDAAGVLV